jgi:hypothetical protein
LFDFLKPNPTNASLPVLESCVKNGWVLLWIYPKGNDTANHKKPSDEEALTIVKAIAKMSRRKP